MYCDGLSVINVCFNRMSEWKGIWCGIEEYVSINEWYWEGNRLFVGL